MTENNKALENLANPAASERDATSHEPGANDDTGVTAFDPSLYEDDSTDRTLVDEELLAQWTPSEDEPTADQTDVFSMDSLFEDSEET